MRRTCGSVTGRWPRTRSQASVRRTRPCPSAPRGILSGRSGHEPLAGAYSRIKLVNPDLVIVLFEADDVAACQLLSMLNMDEDTSGIPVETWATRPETSELEDIIADVNHDS